MRFYLTILGITILMVQMGSSLLAQETKPSAAEEAELRGLFSTYFTALKQGDVQTIKGLLSEDLYLEYKVLLEENTEYPGFLINYYQGVTLRLDRVMKKGEDAVATVIMVFPDGRQSSFKTNAARKERNQPWKVDRSTTDEKKSAKP